MFDSILYHPFITYAFLLSAFFAVLLKLYLLFKPGVRANPWLFLLPLLTPVFAYLINYVVLSKTCGVGFSYTGFFSGFPSYHLFCRINYRLAGIIVPLSVVWLILSIFHSGFQWAWFNTVLGRLFLRAHFFYPNPDEIINLAKHMQIRMPKMDLVKSTRSIIATTGIAKKRILMTSAATEILTDEELLASICHEYAHIKRNSNLVNRLAIIGKNLLLFSPAAHWTYKRFLEEEEFACDEIVSQYGMEKPLASAILKLSKQDLSPLSKERILQLIDSPKHQNAPSNKIIFTCFSLLSVLLLFIC